MGYAEAAGLPAICGLYATVTPLIAYAIFGPSRILVLGPDSALSALIAATILPMAGGNVDRAVALAGMMAILSGCLCVLAGVARFGFITELLSKPIRYGYMNGIAITVLLGQLPIMLGFSASGEDILQRTIGLGNGILQGQTNWSAVVISFFCLLVIRRASDWPTSFWGVDCRGRRHSRSLALQPGAQAGVSVVGPLPQGLPPIRLPSVSFVELRAAVFRRCSDRANFLRRHERAFSHFCSSRGLRSRCQSGTRRTRRGERGSGLVSRLFGEQQLIAHPGGRIGGSENAIGGCRWCVLIALC